MCVNVCQDCDCADVFLPVFGGGAGSQAGPGVQTGAHEMSIKGIILIVWSMYVYNYYTRSRYTQEMPHTALFGVCVRVPTEQCFQLCKTCQE